VVGYKITKGNYSPSTPNLPQRIAILSEPCTANASGLDTTPFQATSTITIADRLGAGSSAYLAYNILSPRTGGGVDGIPIWVYPVTPASGATATVTTLTITGTATKSATHYPVIQGVQSYDGQSYAISVISGDTPTTIAAKLIASINSVYGSSVIASTGGTGIVTLTSVSKGISSVFTTRVELNGVSAGLTYSVTTVAGTLIGDVATALANFENNWNTIVINPYGAESTILNALESVNGKPDPVSPTGRYSAIVFKPFVAFYSAQSTDPLTDFGTDIAARINQCTNSYVPAPNVFQHPVEVAASAARVVALLGQSTPNLDALGQALPGIYVDAQKIGNLADWSYRDSCVKAGISTVDYVGGQLIIKDLVTTYHPDDEVYPQFAYVRNLILDWNVRYSYRLLEAVHVVGFTLIPDGQSTHAEKTVTPSQWKGVMYSMFADLADRALLADVSFSKDSATVQISSTNPDRFESFFRYKRTGTARIASTTAEAGFYYGS
jgi:phage tail sheath gpL-like